MLQKVLLSVAAGHYKLPEIRDNISFMIFSSLNCKILLKDMQVGVDIIVTYQIPLRFTTVFESVVVIRTNYTSKTAN